MSERKAPVASGTSSEKPEVPRSLRRAAMDCLARREHSYFELKNKLQRKFPATNPAEIQQELERLREQNLQSDERFTAALIRVRQAKGYGYLAIREELRRCFVAEALIEKYLFPDDECWQAMLTTLIEKRLPGALPFVFGSKSHLRLYRFLERRGFPADLIQKSLRPFLSRQAG